MLLPYKGARAQWWRWFIGGGAIAALGVLLIATPLGDWFAMLSYDVPFLFRSHVADTNVVVVLEDRASLDALGEKTWPPSRTVHARLVDCLREEGAALVVFDIVFRTERPAEDDIFGAAIRRHGRVILGGIPETIAQRSGSRPGSQITEFKPPVESLRTNAAGWGLLLVGNLDAAYGVRKMTTTWRDMDTAIWLAARHVGGLSEAVPTGAERWINFYGPPPSLDRLTLGEVLELDGRRLSPGSLRGKVVFVGFDPLVTPASGERDVFATPYTRFGHDYSPGVEVLANACANLVRGDWLQRMNLPLQCLLAAAFAVGSLALLLAMGIRRMLFGVVLILALLFSVTLYLQWCSGVWWNWLMPAAVQLPLVALWAVLCPRLPRVAFISYRRKGGDGYAQAVLHALWSRGYDAFIDVQDIGAGEWWPQLRAGIESTRNFVLILSAGALDKHGEGETDWIQQEILHAVAKNKRIIPIIHEDFVWPKPLPPGMEQLPAQEAIPYHPNQPKPTFEKLEVFLRYRRRATL